LVVDQFEELFTLCRDANEQKTFGDLLWRSRAGCCRRELCVPHPAHPAHRPPGALRKQRSSETIARAAAGAAHEAYLSAIGFLEIKRAISEPAKQVGLRFCPTSLVDQLASQTAGLANGLPLLSSLCADCGTRDPGMRKASRWT
jgi:hypothetical protein